MAAIQPERILEIVESLISRVITAVDEPTVGSEYRGRTEKAIAVPPITRAGRRTAGTQYARSRLVDEFLIVLALQALLVRRRWRTRLQPGLDRGVLCVKIRQVRNKVLDDGQVRQRVDLDIALDAVDRERACKRIAAINIHRAGAADSLATRTAKCQRRVNLVLDLDQRVENHRPAVIHIHLVSINTWIVSGGWIVAINGELPDISRTFGRRKVLAFRNARVPGESEFSHNR